MICRKDIFMTIGQYIKKLRKNADMTQENLAEILSISPQAVSRWETDMAMPDLSLIAPLCRLFKVSADELLGIDIAQMETEVDEILAQAASFSNNGYPKEAREILEKGLRKFPNNHWLMHDLMYAISEQSGDDDYTKEQRAHFQKETVELAERLLCSCTEDDIRHGAIQILCYTYKDMGNIEKAISLAEKMPCMAVCKEALMANIKVGDEKFAARQIKLHHLIQFLEVGIHYMNTKMDNGSWRYTEEEVSLLRDKAIAFLHLMFEDGNFGFYHTHLSDTHIDQASYYAKTQNAEKTLHHLRKAAEHAIEFLNWCQGGEYTCLLFKGMPRGSYSTNDKRNEALYVLEEMNSPKYNFLRDDNEFADIKNRIEPLAKYR